MIKELLDKAYTAEVLNQGTLQAALVELSTYVQEHKNEASQFKSKLTKEVTDRCFVSKKHLSYLDQINA